MKYYEGHRTIVIARCMVCVWCVSGIGVLNTHWRGWEGQMRPFTDSKGYQKYWSLNLINLSNTLILVKTHPWYVWYTRPLKHVFPSFMCNIIFPMAINNKKNKDNTKKNTTISANLKPPVLQHGRYANYHLKYMRCQLIPFYSTRNQFHI